MITLKKKLQRKYIQITADFLNIAVQQIPQNNKLTIVNTTQTAETTEEFKSAVRSASFESCKYNDEHTLAMSFENDFVPAVTSYLQSWDTVELSDLITAMSTLGWNHKTNVVADVLKWNYNEIPLIASFKPTSENSADVFIYICGICVRTDVAIVVDAQTGDSSVWVGDVSVDPETIKPVTQIMFTEF